MHKGQSAHTLDKYTNKSITLSKKGDEPLCVSSGGGGEASCDIAEPCGTAEMQPS